MFRINLVAFIKKRFVKNCDCSPFSLVIIIAFYFIFVLIYSIDVYYVISIFNGSDIVQILDKGITSSQQTLIFYFLHPSKSVSWILDIVNTVRSNNLSLKYQRFPPSGFKYIELKKFESVAKNQFLCKSKLDFSALRWFM